MAAAKPYLLAFLINVHQPIFFLDFKQQHVEHYKCHIKSVTSGGFLNPQHFA